MKCKKCKTYAKCIETFEFVGVRYRIYQCQECKERIYTNETVIDSDIGISDFIDKMHRYRKINDTKRRVNKLKSKMK